MNPTDTNQASEDELEKLIEERVKIASTETKSGDGVVQIAWLADGIDLWHRSNGKMGHSPAKARRYIISSVTRLIRTEKLKLLAEVRERVVGEKTSPNFDNEYGYCDNCDFQPTDGTKHCLCYYDEKLRKKQRTALTKLEAEL